MALLTVFLLLLAAFSAEGIWSDAIYHARHEAGVLQNTFSPAGSSQSTSLMHFHIYWASLFIYFLLAVSKLARILWVQEALSSWHRCQKVLSNSNVERPVGINLNFFKWTRWKSINKLAVRVFDSWTAWRLYWKITVSSPRRPYNRWCDSCMHADVTDAMLMDFSMRHTPCNSQDQEL